MSWTKPLIQCHLAHDKKHMRASGVETPLLGRQLPDQLPELGEGQLAVVVRVLGAHQLLDGRVAGVL